MHASSLTTLLLSSIQLVVTRNNMGDVKDEVLSLTSKILIGRPEKNL